MTTYDIHDIFDITPERAKEMLERSKNMRPLIPEHVRRLAEEMRAGRWKRNGDVIITGSDGTVINGQHRLRAIIEAAKSEDQDDSHDEWRDLQDKDDEGK